ncbi:MAG: Nitrilotriacetate monooxygenase component B, partial [uncultured Rubrobacteraceae bacterium]
GQRAPRAKLRTGRRAPPDPWGLRARHPPRPTVERDGRLLGDADLRTTPVRGRRRPRRPLHPRHCPRERDLRPERPARRPGKRGDPLRRDQRRVRRQAPRGALRPDPERLALPPRLPGLPRLPRDGPGPRRRPHGGDRRGHGRRDPGRELPPHLRPGRVRADPPL